MPEAGRVGLEPTRGRFPGATKIHRIGTTGWAAIGIFVCGGLCARKWQN
ncbi:hypothetical protein RSSM_00963 [Rhodopirellula sallentina SM41]|uniref:Uncharacterized protein n=1 Tax=Rhodopirellula sallentina SM41 TaxID=1263870 RepID=M5U830_9BACT|nr:hypothetical protein RSSM_00963 [Rhodopirellula sallentina SM41]